MDTSIDHRKILLVEDEPLVAMMMEDMLLNLGYAEPVLASRVEDAVKFASSAPIDLAVLDVHLNGEFVFPVADTLAAREIPFLFATGRGEKDIPPEHRGRPLLTKPFPPEELAGILQRLAYENVQTARS